MKHRWLKGEEKRVWEQMKFLENVQRNTSYSQVEIPL